MNTVNTETVIQNEILDMNGLTALLKVTRSWVYDHRRSDLYENPLPCRKIGGLLRFSRSDVLDWYQNGRHRKKSDIQK